MKKKRLELEFQSIANRCLDELEATDKPSVRVQWMKMILDCARYLKDEQRLMEGMGASASYVFTITPPAPAVLPESVN